MTGGFSGSFLQRVEADAVNASDAIGDDVDSEAEVDAVVQLRRTAASLRKTRDRTRATNSRGKVCRAVTLS